MHIVSISFGPLCKFFIYFGGFGTSCCTSWILGSFWTEEIKFKLKREKKSRNALCIKKNKKTCSEYSSYENASSSFSHSQYQTHTHTDTHRHRDCNILSQRLWPEKGLRHRLLWRTMAASSWHSNGPGKPFPQEGGCQWGEVSPRSPTDEEKRKKYIYK